jgi:hypothetical protein
MNIQLPLLRLNAPDLTDVTPVEVVLTVDTVTPPIIRSAYAVHAEELVQIVASKYALLFPGTQALFQYIAVFI